jgi:hypothetical protein
MKGGRGQKYLKANVQKKYLNGVDSVKNLEKIADVFYGWSPRKISIMVI